MSDDERWNQRMQESWSSSPTDENSSGCPSDEQIWAAAQDQLARDELIPLLDHTAGCARCARSWRLARRLPEAATSESRLSGVSLRRWSLPIAAVLLLGAVLVPWLVSRSTSSGSQRGGVAALTSPLADGSSLSRDQFRLTWSPVADGASYRLMIASLDGSFTRTIESLDVAEYTVPGEQLGSLPAGTELIWRVVARQPDGRESASPTFRVVLVD